MLNNDYYCVLALKQAYDYKNSDPNARMLNQCFEMCGLGFSAITTALAVISSSLAPSCYALSC